REIGIQPDIIYCRTEIRLKKEAREKIALFCNVAPDAVIEGMDVDSIYEVPIYMEKEKLADKILNLLRLGIRPVELSEWRRFVKKIRHPDQTVNIAIAGKYVELQDAYKSIMEAFVHAGVENNAKVEIVWVATEDVENSSAKTYLKKVSGLLIPGGFGDRGIEGKIEAVRYARENDLPFFGICMGLQCAVIEYARSVCGLVEANSREFSEKQKHSVIDFMPGQDSINRKGGTMRLGAYPCVIKKGTIAARTYRKKKTMERHRHRYEVSNEYRDLLKQHGMVFSGLSPDNTLAEIIELPDKKWFLAVQFHPEFKSRPLRAHPLFGSFVKAALEYQEEKKRITI
ncbi:CTP synthase, partial [bacterium]|nr:CTP synthase [bacterium]